MDFLLDIEAKITVRPVTPKTGLTHRPPYERNMYVVRERARKHFYGTKAAIGTLAENAAKLMARQWALHGTEPPETSIGSSSVTGSTTATVTGKVVLYALDDSATVTIEYGLTKALGTSAAADFSTTTPAGTTNPHDREIDLSVDLTGLTAAKQYFWRIKVVSSGSLYTILSQLRTFKTDSA